MTKMYTANQPLMLGGQIYMWARYFQAKNLVHMMEAQFTKFGHQSRIVLLTRHGAPQTFIVPLEDRNFRPLNDVYVKDYEHTVENFLKTMMYLYPPASVQDIDFLRGLREVFSKGARYSLARLNVMVTDYIWKYLFKDMEGYATHISTKVLPVRPQDPSEWVAEMGVAINCTEYLGGGVAAQAYLQEKHFADRGMTFKSQNYKMPAYQVKKGVENTDAYVSIIDPILRLGKEATLKLIGGAE